MHRRRVCPVAIEEVGVTILGGRRAGGNGRRRGADGGRRLDSMGARVGDRHRTGRGLGRRRLIRRGRGHARRNGRLGYDAALFLGNSDSIQSGNILGNVHPPSNGIEQLTLRRNNGRGWQGGHPVLSGSGGEMIGVNLDGDVVGVQLGGHGRLSKNIGLHLPTDTAPRGPKLDENKPVGLPSPALGILESCLPMNLLLRKPHFGVYQNSQKK